jgi:hypothetical protein
MFNFNFSIKIKIEKKVQKNNLIIIQTFLLILLRVLMEERIIHCRTIATIGTMPIVDYKRYQGN